MIHLNSQRIRGARVRWSETAPSDATKTTLVCLHGYPDTLRVFEALQRALAPSMRVIAIDWPGQGGSEACGVRSPEERARWLHDTLYFWGLHAVTLYGHDMGGLAALHAASAPLRNEASMPRVVINRVFVSNALLHHRQGVSPEIKLLRASRFYRIALPLAPSLIFDRCMHTFFGSNRAQIRKSRNALAWESEMRAHFIESAAEIANICASYDHSLRSNTLARGALLAPVHTLWGTSRLHFAEPHTPWLAARAVQVQATATCIEGGPHWMVATHAREVSEVIRRSMRATLDVRVPV
jgi:pimeloyl-ACP methyl ester carboxylesterase